MQEKRLPSPIALRFAPGSAAVRSSVARVCNIVRNYYRARRLRIVTIILLLIYAITVSLLIMSCGGCASTGGLGGGGARISNFRVYAPFDNSRDWGPNYLVGPPDHRFGSEAPAPLPRTMRSDDPDTSRVQVKPMLLNLQSGIRGFPIALKEYSFSTEKRDAVVGLQREQLEKLGKAHGVWQE
jgi:hypothetical protein